MINPNRRGILASSPQSYTPATKPAKSTPSGPSTPTTRRASGGTCVSSIPRPTTQTKQANAPITPVRRASLLNTPLRARSAPVAVSVASTPTPASAKITVKAHIPAKRVMASLVSPTQSSAATAGLEKEDRISRLTSPTRSSSQKAVEAGPRPAPKRPPGLPKPISAVSAEAGKRPCATSIALTKLHGAKPTIRTPSQSGSAIPRPAVGKAVVSPPARPLRFSPLKSAATVIKKGEPPLSAVQRDRTQDEAVTAVDIISPAAPGPAEETGDPFATDVQSEHGEAPLTDAVPHERPETSELKPIDPVTAAEEPTSNEFQELESEGLFLVGSPFEVGRLMILSQPTR
ncbi:hypothetical protein C8Q72DRAFT_610418 [Fomitopsis betulina]|nr:hypothetical protein C8Q72DRAFT_610418 [Fomitopsis betulina]